MAKLVITRTNFDTTPYHYEFNNNALHYFYISNASWEVYLQGYALPLSFSLKIEFYDYLKNAWVRFGDYTIGRNATFRFFHNSLSQYNNSAYTANTKVIDNTSLSSGGYTYDTRGFSLWRIGDLDASSRVPLGRLDINARGAGNMTEAEYNAVCYHKKIMCGGKRGDTSDCFNHTDSSADSEFSYFLPSQFAGDPITSAMGRKCIPDYTSFRT